MGKPTDVYDRLRAPVGSLFFGGEAVSTGDHQGSVHGAYSAGIMAADNCQSHLLERLSNMEKFHLIPWTEQSHDASIPLQISRM